MKKTLKAALAAILALSMLLSCMGAASAAPAAAQQDNTRIIRTSNFFNAIINGVFALVDKAFPSQGYKTVEEYYAEESENFFVGTEEFIDEPSENARWSLGFGKASIVPDNLRDGSKKYYTGGYFTQKINSVYDDQGVNAVALSDSSGRGTTIFAAVDGIGVGNADVRSIRAAVESKLADKGIRSDINSININSTHCHTVVDTQGISLSLLPKIFHNMLAVLPGIDSIRSMDEEFLEKMIDGASDAIVEAYTSMQTGSLYYFETAGIGNDSARGIYSQDEYNYLYNKRYNAEGYQHTLACFMFVPDAESARTTIFANLGGHPTTISRETEKLSADYPHYLEEKLDESNINFMFVQGAQCPISVRAGEVKTPEVLAAVEAAGEGDEFAPDYEQARRLGFEFARLILAAKENATPVEPILNVAVRECTVKLDRGLFQLGASAQMLGFTTVFDASSDSGYSIITEVCYIEIGKDIAIVTAPGEMVPQLVYGNVVTAEDAYLGTEWTYAATQEVIRSATGDSDKTVLVMGLCNDAIGYIIPDNDYSPFITDTLWSMEIGSWKLGEQLFGEPHRHYEELLATGSTAASSVISTLNGLIEEIAA